MCNGIEALICILVNICYPTEKASLYALRPPTLPFPVRDLGKDAVTSQAGFLNLK